MTPPTQDATARQDSGEPSPIPCQGGNRTSRAGSADITEVDRQIAELLDRSTQALRLAWRQLHRTARPLGNRTLVCLSGQVNHECRVFSPRLLTGCTASRRGP